MANEQIKAVKVTPERVAKTVAPPIHKEPVNKKIYIGPNVPGLTTYTVVDSVKVPHVQRLIEECPAIEKLFVGINKMAEAEQKARLNGTLEHRNYQKVMEYRFGGAK